MYINGRSTPYNAKDSGRKSYFPLHVLKNKVNCAYKNRKQNL